MDKIIECSICHKKFSVRGMGQHKRSHLTANYDIQEGSVVMLKSGSPKMTVYTITDNGNYWCHYYDKDNIKHETAFYKPELALV